jgi:2-amino-4-hydroxy-6-hydroxymethyldihydropteridine diphosphokinase
MIVYLGLGSNLGDRTAHLAGAVRGLSRLDPRLRVSPVYETAPVGGPEQGPYLNCVVGLETSLTARELLAVAHDLERAALRTRAVRNGPRTLDVDLLLVDGLVIDDEDLVVPHPRIGERAFVLKPLEDLDPSLVPSDWRDAVGYEGDQDANVRLVGTLPLG